MDLILWRHAEAEEGAPDAARSLTKKGEKQAEKIAAWLRTRVEKPLRILVSPTERTRQTAQALSSKFAIEPEVGTETTAQRILQAAGWPSAEGTVIIVGHRPSLNHTAALLLSGAEAEWEIRKGAIWWFQTQDDGAPLLRAVMTAKHV